MMLRTAVTALAGVLGAAGAWWIADGFPHPSGSGFLRPAQVAGEVPEPPWLEGQTLHPTYTESASLIFERRCAGLPPT